jgi:peptidoglycan/LPS O-acetylase OafA/YrhL
VSLGVRLHETKISFPKTNASVLLDLIRGLAALLVVFGHGRNYLFVDYKQLAAHPPWVSGAYLVTKAGHQAVVIFFVLSGYLISGSIFRATRMGTFSWPSYLTSRLVRLWVVLLPGLLLCVLWDKIALSNHLAPSLYRSWAVNHMGMDVERNLTLAVFLKNLFFVQGVFGPVFGSDGALWSLSSEFWYYILFPLGLFTLAPASRLKTRLICGALFILIASVGRGFLPLFPVWLAGSLLAVMPSPNFARSTRILAAVAYVPLFFLCASDRIGSDLMDYVLAIGTFFFLWVLLSAKTEAKASSFSTRASRGLASFSYTLYVVHTPLLLLLTALILGEKRWTPNVLTVLEALGIGTLVIAYAYGVATVTEFHTDTVRHWLERRWSVLRPRALSGSSLQPEFRVITSRPIKKTSRELKSASITS